jgi:RIO kinase 2
MRYLTKDDFRVLTAVEMGMKNHELVPVDVITAIAKLRHGGSHKILSTLLRYKLIAHEAQRYDGYRLSYLGYDILALRALLARGKIVSVGSQIGVGKESDIFEAQDDAGNEVVIKIHRLGRTSFRAVRKTRDYCDNKSKSNWLYMSRLAAVKEYAFMQALHAHGFPTPSPIDHSRHVVVMSRVSGFPMAQIKAGKMENADHIFKGCLAILRRLAECGLIHCDFNEFNLMIDTVGNITLIDFPQMVSTSHPNAQELLTRDINCLIKFFAMKMHYVPPESIIFSLSDIVTDPNECNIYHEAQNGRDEQEENALMDFIQSNKQHNMNYPDIRDASGNVDYEYDSESEYEDDNEKIYMEDNIKDNGVDISEDVNHVTNETDNGNVSSIVEMDSNAKDEIRESVNNEDNGDDNNSIDNEEQEESDGASNQELSADMMLEIRNNVRRLVHQYIHPFCVY